MPFFETREMLLTPSADRVPPVAVAGLRMNKAAAIFQAITDLHAAGRVVTRRALMEATSLAYSQIDDHVKRWLDDGRLRRISPGVIEPVEQMPEARAVSCTRLPNGLTKLEIGDVVLDLVPGEARMLGQLLSSAAGDLSALNAVRDLADGIAELQRQLKTRGTTSGQASIAMSKVESTPIRDLSRARAREESSPSS